MAVFYDENCEFELSSNESVVDVKQPVVSIVDTRTYIEVLTGRCSDEEKSLCDEDDDDDSFIVVNRNILAALSDFLSNPSSTRVKLLRVHG